MAREKRINNLFRYPLFAASVIFIVLFFLFSFVVIKRADITSKKTLSLQNDFPVYPNATFVRTTSTPPCANQTNGYSFCDSTIYEWLTDDDYDMVQKWYKENGNGWVKTGGAGAYGGPWGSLSKSTYRKGDLKYEVLLDTDDKTTKIILGIPTSGKPSSL